MSNTAPTPNNEALAALKQYLDDTLQDGTATERVVARTAQRLLDQFLASSGQAASAVPTTADIPAVRDAGKAASGFVAYHQRMMVHAGAGLLATPAAPAQPRGHMGSTPWGEIDDSGEDTGAMETDAVDTLVESGWIWDGDQWQRPPTPHIEPRGAEKLTRTGTYVDGKWVGTDWHGEPSPQSFETCHANESGWCDWQQPIMQGYLMKCCDCGLVHEVEFEALHVTGPTAPDGGWPFEALPTDEYRVQFRMRRWQGASSTPPAPRAPSIEPAQAVEQLMAANERIDELRRALEIIAVGDAQNPQLQAAEELIALGYWRDIPEARASLAAPASAGVEEFPLPPFEHEWAKKEAEGYRYGEDALEQVRFGYEIAADALRSYSASLGLQAEPSTSHKEKFPGLRRTQIGGGAIGNNCLLLEFDCFESAAKTCKVIDAARTEGKV